MEEHDTVKDAGTSSTIATSCSPFEWLTDSASVVPLVESALSQLHQKGNNEAVRILHVGSGSSILGEHLVETMGDRMELVVNVDKDVETLQKMQARWDNNKSLLSKSDLHPKLRFVTADFAATRDDNNDLIIPEYPAGYFDIAIDKSTLDCTLCSDSATAGLLTEVYRLLKPSGGTYIVISFHHVDMLQPLFQDLPGADWHVSHSIMQRQVEDLITPKSNSKGGTCTLKPTTNDVNHQQQQLQANQKVTSGEHQSKNNDKNEGAWASGTFEPDEQYRRTVNVFVCRRQEQDANANANNNLDRAAVMGHVHATNDRWFQQHNPMLTSQRRETIRDLFAQHTSSTDAENSEYGGSTAVLCSLEVAYNILFTEAEREHLTYDLFLEDWEAWVAEMNDLIDFPKDKMTLESALDFLEAMQ